MADLSSLLGTPGKQVPSAAPTSHEVDSGNDTWRSHLRIGEAYNQHLPSTWDASYVPPTASASVPRVSLAVSTDLKQWNYRYMFEKKGERSMELDTRLSVMGDEIRHAFGLTAEWDDPSIPNQESIYTVGRICARVDPGTRNEEQKEHVRLTPANLMLETSRMVGNGQRISLVIDPQCTVRYAWASQAESISSVTGLFPGMILGVKGRNGSGQRFVAEELLIPPPLPHPATLQSELMTNQYGESRLAGTPLRVMMAGGPFTPTSDLEYGPWHAFMTHVELARPDVLLLLGPFVSVQHPIIATGNLDTLPTDLFKHHISRRITRLIERSPSTVVILVPSTDDMIHTHYAYPQPFLDKSDPTLGLPKRVRCLPNPSVFYVNELAIGVSTADTLGDLRREELVQRVQSGSQGTPQSKGVNDPIVRLARHVLGQRHFYPLFPPSPVSRVPLDLSHSRLCAFDTSTPDLILLPSTSTKPCIRIVDSSVVVNPGSLVSSDESGTHPSAYVQMQVDPMPRERLQATIDDADPLLTHELYRRARIDLVYT